MNGRACVKLDGRERGDNHSSESPVHAAESPDWGTTLASRQSTLLLRYQPYKPEGMVEELHDNIRVYLAAHRKCVVSARRGSGTTAFPVRYAARGFEIECLIPLWADISFCLEQNPSVTVTIVHGSGDDGPWMKVEGTAAPVISPQWDALLPAKPANVAFTMSTASLGFNPGASISSTSAPDGDRARRLNSDSSSHACAVQPAGPVVRRTQERGLAAPKIESLQGLANPARLL